MSKHMEFYIQDDATSIQIGKNVYRRVSIPIDDFNAACDHYGFVKERTCRNVGYYIDGTRFKCSECGYNGWTKWAKGGEDRVPNYCPNCGAKVVGE